MTDPLKLKIGDLVRFVSIPEEWSTPGYQIHRDSVTFTKRLIRRSFPSRVVEIDEQGSPWIHAIIRQRGQLHYHSWAITVATGWRLGKRRKDKAR